MATRRIQQAAKVQSQRVDRATFRVGGYGRVIQADGMTAGGCDHRTEHGSPCRIGGWPRTTTARSRCCIWTDPTAGRRGSVAKLEAAMQEAIARGARRQVRVVVRPLRREVTRLRLKTMELGRALATRRRSAVEASRWLSEPAQGRPMSWVGGAAAISARCWAAPRNASWAAPHPAFHAHPRNRIANQG